MRLTELRGLPVVDPRAARRVGGVSGVTVDTGTGRLAEIEVDGVASEAQARLLVIPASQVSRIGAHAVMLTGAPSPEPASVASDDGPVISIDALVGLEVLSDAGDRVGHLVDAHFDPDTLQVRAYELASPFWEKWLGGKGLITPEEVLACSGELMIVPSSRHLAGPEEEHTVIITPTEEATTALPKP